MGFEYIIVIGLISVCLICIAAAIFMQAEPEHLPRHPGQPLTGAGPKPRFKTPSHKEKSQEENGNG